MPLGGVGGRLAVLDHTHPGRLKEGVIPCLVNTSNITEFTFDPFNPNILAVGKCGRVGVGWCCSRGMWAWVDGGVVMCGRVGVARETEERESIDDNNNNNNNIIISIYHFL